MYKYNVPQRQVHLDFHTSERIKGIGKRFSKENFRNCLKVGHVNSITLFAKCHHGWSYYPSKVNPMHPELDFDLLSAELEVCRELGIGCPIYISAGFDEKYACDHPDHCVKRTRDFTLPPVAEEDGYKYFNYEKNAWYNLLCFNTPYLDHLLNQVREVVETFMPEGIFLDITDERLCFCDHCKQSVRDMGLDENDDEAFKKLSKIVYKNYYTRVREVATAIKPDIKIFHNSGHIHCGRRDLAHSNTHLELESLPTGGWGYDHFPASAKYVSSLGMSYLGMTGKFHFSWGEFGGFKHPNALRYEIALSLAFGARCSIGDQMHPYGFLDPATYELIGAAYSEAEKVEEYCYDIKPLADVGILSASATGLPKNNRSDIGACRIMLEGKYLFDILDTECDFSAYKVIILPDDCILENDDLLTKLKSYAANGGKILAAGKVGKYTNDLFDLGSRFIGASKFNPSYLAPTYNATGLTPTSYVMYKQMYVTSANEGAKILAYAKETFFNRTSAHFCSHKHTPYTEDVGTPAITFGKNGAYIALDIFTEYADMGSYSPKEAVIKTLDELLGCSKTIKTNLPSVGVVSLNEQPKENRFVLHALYATPIKRGGANTSVEVIEDIVPIHNTSFEIKLDKEVKSVTLVPQNTAIPFVYENGILKFEIDKFECKQVVSINL